MSEFGPYPAKVVLVHDGDTISFDIDLGFDHQISAFDLQGNHQLACRVRGINAPELWTDAGKAARDYAAGLLPVGTLVQIRTYGWDKYGGRFDGAITLPDGRDFAQAMLDAGQAVPFMVS